MARYRITYTDHYDLRCTNYVTATSEKHALQIHNDRYFGSTKTVISVALVSAEATAEELREILQKIVDDASPCASACSRLVDESLIERAEELLQKK